MEKIGTEHLVLVVEDDTDILSTMEELLTLSGYSVSLARNGLEALQCLDTQRPCVILLDLMMPVMNGRQFLEHRRGDQALAQIPVIVLSAAADQVSNFDDVSEVFLKPIDIKTLVNTINRFC
jgi:two-component system, chemotaxis family, chemotaxis protein CheY